MRIQGLRKKIYLIIADRPALDRKLLQAARSLDSIKQLLQRDQKETRL